jgi:hypothetical protein
MGTEEGMGNFPTSSVGSDDVLMLCIFILYNIYVVYIYIVYIYIINIWPVCHKRDELCQ